MYLWEQGLPAEKPACLMQNTWDFSQYRLRARLQGAILVNQLVVRLFGALAIGVER